mmetsp:Transcript_33890/g.78175  ORF Transcript_33890/g.78175 Transcript_33890/m.78175 type:complete len:258 (+) Transcript_33890:137-910(+)|eukprot:CAMPEP_0116843842 /NCGR_PEP_ID=MMETSP0418-20121206/12326_1 /TAXON_ID=1158023 /ORGANISM="Astrosyne radiata, Strain 13vi08-1A" /LENGTH=257 /DNA_ID=CAMNT_0004474667 /DNA_START=229 /DNA_END=1002 /DNA_ORIENTATION=-
MSLIPPLSHYPMMQKKEISQDNNPFPAVGGLSSLSTRSTTEPRQQNFEPYDRNGGSSVVVAGSDFCVVAADTRIASGYEIFSRESTKIFPITSTAVLTSTGSKNDVDEFRRALEFDLKVYRYNHGKEMSVSSIAQLVSNKLYSRRMFPYYSFQLLAGLDSDGKGAAFGYDAIGSMERVKFEASGSGEEFLAPFFDNMIGHQNREDEPIELDVETVINIIKDGFVACGERDQYTGDAVEVLVITKDGMQRSTFNLKAD